MWNLPLQIATVYESANAEWLKFLFRKPIFHKGMKFSESVLLTIG